MDNQSHQPHYQRTDDTSFSSVGYSIFLGTPVSPSLEAALTSPSSAVSQYSRGTVGRSRRNNSTDSIDSLMQEIGIRKVTLSNGSTRYGATYLGKNVIVQDGVESVSRGGFKFRSQAQVDQLLEKYSTYKELMHSDSLDDKYKAVAFAKQYLTKEVISAAENTVNDIVHQNVARENAFTLKTSLRFGKLVNDYQFEAARDVADQASMMPMFQSYFHEFLQKQFGTSSLSLAYDRLSKSRKVDDRVKALKIARNNQSFNHFSSEMEQNIAGVIQWDVGHGDYVRAEALAKETSLVDRYDAAVSKQIDDFQKLKDDLSSLFGKTSSSLYQGLIAKMQEKVDFYLTAIGNKTQLQGEIDYSFLTFKKGNFSYGYGDHALFQIDLHLRQKDPVKPKDVLSSFGKYVQLLDAELRIDNLLIKKSKEEVQQAYHLAIEHNLRQEDVGALLKHLEKHERFESELQEMYSQRTDLFTFERALDKYRAEGLAFDPNQLLKEYWKSQPIGKRLKAFFKTLFPWGNNNSSSLLEQKLVSPGQVSFDGAE